jgi:hypothetical protein
MSTTTHVWRPSSARRVVLDGFVPLPRGTQVTTPLPMTWPAKDPEDVLDYEFDISAALVGNEADAITSLAVTVSPNASGDLTLNSSAADGAVAVMWFSGGQTGTVYTVQITIVTTNGRTIGPGNSASRTVAGHRHTSKRDRCAHYRPGRDYHRSERQSDSPRELRRDANHRRP